MDIRKQLLVRHSKENTNLIVDYIGDDRTRFQELIELFLSDNYRVTQRAAWVVGDAARNRPELVDEHLETIVLNLRKPDLHVAVKRNTLRILQEIQIPESLWGEAADIAFDFLTSNDEPVAVKVFAMQVIHDIALNVPELAQELIFIIEDQMPYSTAGFKSRGRKLLKSLKKLSI